MEALEGRLIRIENLRRATNSTNNWAAATTIAAVDGSNNPIDIRIQTGSTATSDPGAPVTVIGVLGQYDGSNPPDSVYQIMPRTQTDLIYTGTPTLTLTISGSLDEAQGENSPGILTITRQGDLNSSLSVELSAGVAGVIRGTETLGGSFVDLPLTVTIPAGEASLQIDLAAVDNSTYQTSVSLTATATGYQSGSLSITIVDNDAPPSDTTPPVITLTGSATVTVAWGGSYSDAGATATDNVDSSVTVNSSGTVNTAKPGTYTITYTASDVAGNAATPVTRTVTVSAPANTPGADGLSALLRYAFGGNAPGDTVTKPSSTVSGGNLVLTAIVRTNDAKLAVVGEAVTSLADYTNAPSITTVNGSASGVDQTGAPAGCERQAFTVPQGADTRKFLRLKATLAP
jgi:hypothetical protein